MADEPPAGSDRRSFMMRSGADVPLTVLTATAALPIGANVFIFSQRYGVAMPLITASVVVSTLVALFSVSLVMLLAGGT